jgi:hypothetical protein
MSDLALGLLEGGVFFCLLTADVRADALFGEQL